MSTYEEERLRAVRIIESLRSGVPTRDSTRELPDLRSELMEPIRSDLEACAADKAPRGRLLWGPYGQGKSHFLTVVEHLALDMNFAVSFVSFSRDICCDKLFRFYQRVAPAVRTPDSEVPGLQKQLSTRRPCDLDATPIPHPNRYPHPLPSAVLELLLHGQGDEESYALYLDLMGDRLRLAEVRRVAQGVAKGDLLRNLPRFKMGEHAAAYYGVLADAIRFCGYRGWVILIDEVELIARLGKVSRLDAYRNLSWLLNWSGTMLYPIYALGAAASSLTDFWRDETRRRETETLAIPKLASDRLGPEAESTIRHFFETAEGDQCLTLRPAAPDAIFNLLRCIVRLHGLAHGWSPPEDEEWLRRVTGMLKADDKLRVWLRLVLEALDLCMVTGQTPELEPSVLTEHSLEENEEFSQDQGELES